MNLSVSWSAWTRWFFILGAAWGLMAAAIVSPCRMLSALAVAAIPLATTDWAVHWRQYQREALKIGWEYRSVADWAGLALVSYSYCLGYVAISTLTFQFLFSCIPLGDYGLFKVTAG